jgi:hypothetical protein
MVGVLLLLARGPMPRRVFHEGKWVTVRPRTTREELEEAVDRDTLGADGETGEGGARG